MRRILAASAMLALVFSLIGVSASASPGDKDCADFPSQVAAQDFFNANGGSATNNFDDLDANHNGIACEDHKYATLVEIQNPSGPIPKGAADTGDGSAPIQ